MKWAKETLKRERKLLNNLDSTMTKWQSIDGGNGWDGDMW
jgi:hypothetical protein